MTVQTMVRTGVDSHFEIISGKKLPEYGDRILQIYPNSLYENAGGYAVFLCEVANAQDNED